MKKFEWKRNCPGCGNEISYTRKFSKDKAEKQNTNCRLCAMSIDVRKKISEFRKGIKFTNEHKINLSKNNARYWLGKKREPFTDKHKKNMRRLKNEDERKRISKSHLGENNYMYGKSVYDIWLEKYGKEEADNKWEKRNKRIRLTILKNIKNRYGQISPNYNPAACEIIRWYNIYYDFSFRHAENGGEVCIDGYFPDGVDEKRKTIIEIDEPRHFNSDGTLKEKDIRRQGYLENLGYEFIRIKI